MQQPLTPREKQVFELLALGLSHKKIGRQLRMSHRTVEDHKYHICKKIGTSDRLGVMREAMRRNPLMPCPCCGRMEAAE